MIHDIALLDIVFGLTRSFLDAKVHYVLCSLATITCTTCWFPWNYRPQVATWRDLTYQEVQSPIEYKEDSANYNVWLLLH